MPGSVLGAEQTVENKTGKTDPLGTSVPELVACINSNEVKLKIQLPGCTSHMISNTQSPPEASGCHFGPCRYRTFLSWRKGL